MKNTRHSTNLLLAACVVAFGVASAAYGQQCASTFAGAANYVAAQLPKSVVIGDLNGDGKSDLAVANSGSNSVSVLLGNGNGMFAAAVDYGAGTTPLCVAIGDVNGDGQLDLAVANSGSNNVSVLLGNGDGTFQTQVNYGASTSPSSVAIGDLNGDGKADLAVANSGSNNVSGLLGNGDGTFQTGVNYNVGSIPYCVAIGDLNGDGRPDLVVANNSGSNVSVLVGNGNGTFQAQAQYTTEALPYFAAIGDLNGDGKPDLAVACANTNNNSVSVLLNTGIGNPNMFSARVNYFAGLAPAFAAIGDLNGDGRPDLATANSGDHSVSVLLGNGNGTFQTSSIYGAGATGTHPYCVAIGDFNGDGRPDLAVANYNSNYISVLLNTSPMIGISPQPASQSVTQGQTAVFTATASGTGPFSYHWRRNSAPLYNVGHVSGAFTNTLTLSNASAADIGAYDVQVSGGCNYAAIATSNSAALSVCAPPLCKGDFNNDGQFNSLDIQEIVNAMLAGQTCP